LADHRIRVAPACVRPPHRNRAMTTPIKQADLIESISAALQYIS
jgi:hypothetical protein